MRAIPVFIPVVNRVDLLEKAIASVPNNSLTEPIVLNNTGGDLDIHCKGITPSVPLTASQTLNLMQKIAKMAQSPFYFFMHNDAEAEPGTVERLYEMAYRKHSQRAKWGVIFTFYDTLAAYNTEAFDAVGKWDTNLPQYYTDNDMYRRLKIAGYELAESGLTVKHVGSQTINSDPLRKRINDITFPIYTRYYAEKWGGPPGNETFLRPWNQ
jgi:hypothetical protein